MTYNWKVIVLAAIVVLAAVALVFYYYPSGEEITPTGKVDDAVDALLQSSLDEQALSTDVETDAALIDADSQTISDFDQSYNENEL